MLLRILSPIVRFALWVFFRRIDIRGWEQVPGDRPILYVANHPNVALDSLLLAASVPGKPPSILGKSTLFKNRLCAFFLRQLGVIPVVRKQDSGTRTGRNHDMLKQACLILQQGGALALFPEGISHPVRQVLPLKTGAARIALRVEDEADGLAGVRIVPVGLTYTAPDLFRSQVSVHFGAPIDVTPFLAAYRNSRQGGAQELTTLVHQRLTELTWHVENPGLEQVIDDLSAVYADPLAAEFPDSATLSSRLRAGQELIRAVHYYESTDPDLVRAFSDRLRLHHRKLRRLRLEPYTFPTAAVPPGRGNLLLTFLLAPMALYGFINNALPYFLPRLFVRPYRQTPEMIGTIKLAIGSAAFPLYYLIRTGIATLIWGWPWALFYGLTLPLSGLFVLFYKERLLERWPLWQGLTTPRRRAYYLQRLATERAQLLRDIEALKAEYLNHVSPQTQVVER